MKRVAVIGAGTMGSGIAEALAAAPEHQVLLCDLSPEYAEKGMERIAGGLRGRVERGKLAQTDADALLTRITIGEIDDVSECRLVVEAIVEELGSKRKLFEQLDELCEPDAVLATNTSSLSITEIGCGLKHPIVGMHFFNPAPVMKLVEVTAGAATPPEIVTFIKELAQAIGKTPVEVDEAPGFVVNRILIPMINEAVELVANGTASIEDVDVAMKLGANHPMGPLALGDLIGLDVVLAIMEVIHSETGDPKYRPHPLLRKYVRAGWLGRKTGRGFHSYDH
ncbi:MAG: 3-hydroxyacyl-CoA dehydrogenase NAD-binding domain-containing protein [Propionibacteriaceae bacterium]|nr:3-hydroxyacyl-CoA dehydrogenase NAD-binding domain-containing protein [Propionibacteriaceae bacterium]